MSQPPDDDARRETRRKKADDLLVVALASGLGVRAAAKKARVSEKTAHRRLAEPDFQARVDAAKKAIIDRAMAILTSGTTKAARELKRLLKNSDARVRLRAARSIIELLSRIREESDLRERVAMIEELLAQREAKDTNE